jgi:hypothetical protein
MDLAQSHRNAELDQYLDARNGRPSSARLYLEALVMTTPANAIKDEIRELIHVQIDRFGKPSSLTSSEIEECQTRAERIKMLGQELDRMGRMAILEEPLGRAS